MELKIAVYSAIFGILGTIVGAVSQGYFDYRLEKQKFEYALITETLDVENATASTQRLLFLMEIGLIGEVDSTMIEFYGANLKQIETLRTAPFLRHVQAYNYILGEVKTFRLQKKRWPKDLWELRSTWRLEPFVNFLGMNNIYYSVQPGGDDFELRFAGPDNKLSTSDDTVCSKKDIGSTGCGT